jgi:hypothetical protein
LQDKELGPIIVEEMVKYIIAQAQK